MAVCDCCQVTIQGMQSGESISTLGIPMRLKPPSMLPYGHSPAYEACERIDLVAGCDLRPEIREKWGQRFGLDQQHVYADYKEMIQVHIRTSERPQRAAQTLGRHVRTPAIISSEVIIRTSAIMYATLLITCVPGLVRARTQRERPEIISVCTQPEVNLSPPASVHCAPPSPSACRNMRAITNNSLAAAPCCYYHVRGQPRSQGYLCGEGTSTCHLP